MVQMYRSTDNMSIPDIPSIEARSTRLIERLQQHLTNLRAEKKETNDQLDSDEQHPMIDKLELEGRLDIIDKNIQLTLDSLSEAEENAAVIRRTHHDTVDALRELSHVAPGSAEEGDARILLGTDFTKESSETHGHE